MPKIYPFKALMPAAGLEIKVSANTHVDDKRKQTDIVKTNPQSYLKVVKPYLILDEEKDPAKHFEYAQQILTEFIANGTMKQDENETLYIYRQVNRDIDIEYIGIICKVLANDYYDGHIKVHENTLTEKENHLIAHIKVSGAIGEPVLLTHFENQDIEELLNKIIKNQPADVDFFDEVNRHHFIYKITNTEEIIKIQNTYAQLSDFYIADGHHRSAACARYYKNKCDENGGYLAYIVPANHLLIDSFYRAFKSNETFNLINFINTLRLSFNVEKVDSQFIPIQAMQFGLCTYQGWYKLTFNNNLQNQNAVEKLDVSIIENYVFDQILHIKDSKTDNQLTFIKGNTHVSSIEKQVQNSNFDIVFTVFPCKIEEVFTIADQKMIMPPKSTYIEPKLRTGLTVQLV